MFLKFDLSGEGGRTGEAHVSKVPLYHWWVTSSTWFFHFLIFMLSNAEPLKTPHLKPSNVFRWRPVEVPWGGLPSLPLLLHRL